MYRRRFPGFLLAVLFMIISGLCWAMLPMPEEFPPDDELTVWAWSQYVPAPIIPADCLDEQLADQQALVRRMVRTEERIAEMAREELPAARVEQIEAEADRRAVLGTMNYLLRESIEIDEEAVREEAESRRAEFQTPEKVAFRYIFLPGKLVDEESAAAVGRELEEVGFDTLFARAKERGWETSGDRLASGARGQFAPAIDEALFALAAGGASSLVRTDKGWHVFQVQDHKPATARTTEEIMEVIRAEMFGHERKKRFEEFNEKLNELYPEEIVKPVEEWETFSEDDVIAKAGDEEITLGQFLKKKAEGAYPATKSEMDILRSVIQDRQALLYGEESSLSETPVYKAIYLAVASNHLAEEYVQNKAESYQPPGEEIEKLISESPEDFMSRPETTVTEYWASFPPRDESDSAEAWFYLKREREEAMAGFLAALREKGAEAEPPPFVTKRDRGTAPMGPRGRLLDMAVQGLEVGEYSDIVEDRQGWSIFQLVAEIEPKALSGAEQRERAEIVLRGRYQMKLLCELARAE